MDIYKNLNRIDNAQKIVKHKTELQQCEFYMNMLMQPTLNSAQVYEAEQFANNMYEVLKRESPIIANENTSPVPRNIDAVDNLRMNLQAIHKMLTQIMIKGAKDIVNK